MTDTTDTKPKGTPFVGFRASDLQDALEARQPDPDGQALGLTAKRDLGRYYDALRRELKLAAATLTRGEKLALCDVSNGTLWDSLSAGYLWAEVADADPAQLAQWGVDQDALVAKLRALTPTQSLALVDALERWWLLPEVTDHDESLRAVGLA